MMTQYSPPKAGSWFLVLGSLFMRFYRKDAKAFARGGFLTTEGTENTELTSAFAKGYGGQDAGMFDR